MKDQPLPLQEKIAATTTTNAILAELRRAMLSVSTQARLREKLGIAVHALKFSYDTTVQWQQHKTQQFMQC